MLQSSVSLISKLLQLSTIAGFVLIPTHFLAHDIGTESLKMQLILVLMFLGFENFEKNDKKAFSNSQKFSTNFWHNFCVYSSFFVPIILIFQNSDSICQFNNLHNNHLNLNKSEYSELIDSRTVACNFFSYNPFILIRNFEHYFGKKMLSRNCQNSLFHEYYLFHWYLLKKNFFLILKSKVFIWPRIISDCCNLFIFTSKNSEK